jgi:hypothetical protein
VPREVVALVSSDDVVAAVRVHADRVHDLLRRSGCGADEAVEVCESYAFALIDALVNAPDTVVDMAGWWLGRALELGRRLGEPGAEPAGAATRSVLAGTSGEAQVRAALAALPEQERAAALLRDGYDLPPQAVAVALRRDLESTAALIALGRLRLVAHYDDRHVPDLSGHTGRMSVDLGTLALLADGSLPSPRAVPLRRHVSSCAACEDAVETMAKGRRLAAALPVLAMPDDAREAMLERVAIRAGAVLPNVDEVLRVIEEDDAVPPVISPIAVVLAIVLALVLGVALAAVTTSRGDGGDVAVAVPTVEPRVQPSFTVAPSTTPAAQKRHRSSSPSTTPSTSAPPAPTSASPAASVSSTPAVGVAVVAASPSSGPRGTVFTVAGRGWDPGATVTVRYGSLGGGSTSATVDSRGRFAASLNANAPLPGTYTVTATSDTRSAQTTFRQT